MITNKIIYVCSPLRGNIKDNIRKAINYCRKLALNNCIPIAPHIYFTQFLDDKNSDERNIGMNYGLQLLQKCDELYAYCKDFESASQGMKLEIQYAEMLKIPVIYKGN